MVSCDRDGQRLDKKRPVIAKLSSSPNSVTLKSVDEIADRMSAANTHIEAEEYRRRRNRAGRDGASRRTRVLAASLQHHPAHQSLGYKPPAPEVFLPAFAAWRLRHVNRFAGHARATVDPELTFRLDHLIGADQSHFSNR